MSTPKERVDELRGEITTLVDLANFYHTTNHTYALDCLDTAKAKMQEMYRLIWATVHVSGKP